MTILSTRHTPALPALPGGSYITGPTTPTTEGTYISMPAQSAPAERGTYVTISAPPRNTVAGSYTQIG